jgi:hypothetical protein
MHLLYSLLPTPTPYWMSAPATLQSVCITVHCCLCRSQQRALRFICFGVAATALSFLSPSCSLIHTFHSKNRSAPKTRCQLHAPPWHITILNTVCLCVPHTCNSADQSVYTKQCNRLMFEKHCWLIPLVSKLVVLCWLYQTYIRELYIDWPIQNIIRIKKFCLNKSNNQTIIAKRTLDLIKVILNQNYFQYNAIYFSPLNAKLNPICHLLALLGARPILHVSR